jgi:ABC-type uncharacterized transport system substrate-binding protein
VPGRWSRRKKLAGPQSASSAAALQSNLHTCSQLFGQGLREAGFVEGENVTIVFRWAEGNYGPLSNLASELVDLKVALLLAAGGPPAALAAKAATSTIPIVFSGANDPVRAA